MDTVGTDILTPRSAVYIVLQIGADEVDSGSFNSLGNGKLRMVIA